MTTDRKAYNRQYYLAHRREALKKAAEYREQHRAQINKSAVAAYYQKREQILLQKKEYTKRTRAQRAAYNKQYRAANYETLKAQKKQYRQENRAQINAINRRYWAAHPEKFLAWKRKWQQRNPGKMAEQDSKRRARMRSAKVDARGAAQFYAWIHNQDFVTCTYCGVYISGSSVAIDHIVPLARGGAHEPDNFCVSCKSCNSSKHNLLLHEWKRCPAKIRGLIEMVGLSSN